MGGRVISCPLDISNHTSQANRGEFSMTYGAEVVIPLEIGFPTLKTSTFNLSDNNGLLEKNLDLIEERRESAMV